MNKKLIHAAIVFFTGVLAVAVLLHVIVFNRGFHSNWSISRYMGADYWSAIVFAIVNCLIIALVLRYMWQVRKEHHLSILWLICVIIMMAAYLGLSCCPIGLFDEVWGKFGTVSELHHIFSNTLFITMAILAIDTMIEMREGKALLVYGAILLCYAAFCVYGYTSKASFFMGNIFFFETGYILANLFFYELIPKKG